jgi:hypothetical protein
MLMAIEIVEFPMPVPEWQAVDWWAVRGNHHRRLVCTGRMGGPVKFAEHLGKPLSDRLWDDLVHRLKVGHLAVFRPGEAEWTLGRLGNHAVVRLDENENVRDVAYWPGAA